MFPYQSQKLTRNKNTHFWVSSEANFTGILFDIKPCMAKRILVADDDPGIQDIFKIILESAGYIVEIISNGEDLLDDNYTVPDLFLLDKRLSGIDGIDICHHLKNQEITAHIPVIMVSANPGIGVLAREAGADDFIEKPFDIKHLLEQLLIQTKVAPM